MPSATPKQRDPIWDILHIAKLLGNSFQAICSYGTLLTGTRLTQVFRPIKYRTHMQNLEKQIRALVKNKSLDIRLNFDPKLPTTFRMDKHLFLQVISSLIKYAI
jgi:hypothetical protein